MIISLLLLLTKKIMQKIKMLEKKFKLKISVIGKLINKKGVFLDKKNFRRFFSFLEQILNRYCIKSLHLALYKNINL